MTPFPSPGTTCRYGGVQRLQQLVSNGQWQKYYLMARPDHHLSAENAEGRSRGVSVSRKECDTGRAEPGITPFVSQSPQPMAGVSHHHLSTLPWSPRICYKWKKHATANIESLQPTALRKTNAANRNSFHLSMVNTTRIDNLKT